MVGALIIPRSATKARERVWGGNDVAQTKLRNGRAWCVHNPKSSIVAAMDIAAYLWGLFPSRWILCRGLHDLREGIRARMPLDTHQQRNVFVLDWIFHPRSRNILN
jgi:hypothetical protein